MSGVIRAACRMSRIASLGAHASRTVSVVLMAIVFGTFVVSRHVEAADESLASVSSLTLGDFLKWDQTEQMAWTTGALTVSFLRLRCSRRITADEIVAGLRTNLGQEAGWRQLPLWWAYFYYMALSGRCKWQDECP